MKLNRNSPMLWPLGALSAAVLCSLLRVIQRATAFEGQLELPLPGAPATVILVIFLVLSFVGAYLLSQRQRVSRILRKRPYLALEARDSMPVAAMLVTAAFLALIAAPFLLINGWELWVIYRDAKQTGSLLPSGGNGVLTLLCGLFSLLSFCGLGYTAKCMFDGRRISGNVLLFPVICSCLWLMNTYREHAANPVQWDYAPLLLSIVAGILFYLDWSGLYAGVSAPRRTLVTASMTVILSATALVSGEWQTSGALLLTQQLAAALAVLWCIPKNLICSPESAPAPAQVKEKLEEKTHE